MWLEVQSYDDTREVKRWDVSPWPSLASYDQAWPCITPRGTRPVEESGPCLTVNEEEDDTCCGEEMWLPSFISSILEVNHLISFFSYNVEDLRSSLLLLTTFLSPTGGRKARIAKPPITAAPISHLCLCNSPVTAWTPVTATSSLGAAWRRANSQHVDNKHFIGSRSPICSPDWLQPIYTKSWVVAPVADPPKPPVQTPQLEKNDRRLYKASGCAVYILAVCGCLAGGNTEFLSSSALERSLLLPCRGDKTIMPRILH
ncbi:hypothetical protein O3P69_004511 [Scylla paramamosain]|uniref:Uncharacterized protein n=1 Tax=Scylla paramamosain TaxID=85552 RepID=A0AAW0UDH2_SCYPA